MEDIDHFWTFHESVEDLRQRLEYKTYELEMTKNESNEEMRKNNEHIKKLLQLLQSAYKERDDAKAELNKLQQTIAFHKSYNNNNNVFVDQFTTTSAAPFSPDSPLLTPNFATKAHSGITDSSNHNFNTTHVSSPAASSPDTTSPVFMSSATTNQVVDHESLIIANLAKRKKLPQKGKLLQAVLGAGPLLSTLLVAGSLPNWRNPPGVLTHQIPPVNLKGCTGGMTGQSPRNSNLYTSRPQPSKILPQQVVTSDVSTSFGKELSNYSSMYNDNNNNGSFGVCPSPMLDFGSGSSCLIGGRMMITPGVSSFDSQIPKRQRIV